MDQRLKAEIKRFSEGYHYVINPLKFLKFDPPSDSGGMKKVRVIGSIYIEITGM